jgi:hypothetical protein
LQREGNGEAECIRRLEINHQLELGRPESPCAGRSASSRAFTPLFDGPWTRVNYICEKCRNWRATEVHHLTYIRVFQELPSDLVALSKPCHAEIHWRQPANDNQLQLSFDFPQEANAYHEAGHAIVGWALDLCVFEIRICDDRPGEHAKFKAEHLAKGLLDYIKTRAPRTSRRNDSRWRSRRLSGTTIVSAKWRKSLVDAQDALMIGKTSRAVAVTNARPTTPRTANTAKDTFSTVIPRVCCFCFGLMGCVLYFSERQ